MGNPLKVTLDTNCIINLLDDNSESRTSYDDLALMMGFADKGFINIYVTTRFEMDQANDKDRDRVIRIAKGLSELPVETVGAGFRLDNSRLDGSDFLGDDETIAINNELIRLLSPNGLDPKSRTFSNRINDIDHLIGHYKNDHDLFITDDKGILKKSETMRNSLGITVMSPGEFTKYIRSQITSSLSTHITDVPDNYYSKPSRGLVEFDYSNNNGKFTIGQGIYAFDTKWSKASDVSIHAYSDGENIEAIAIGKNVNDIDNINDYTPFDYSSRVRTVGIGQILLVKNKHGAYAVIRVKAIRDDSRGKKNDLLSLNMSSTS